MNLPREALHDLRRFVPALFCYVFASMLAVFLFRLFYFAQQQWLPEEAHKLALTLTRLLSALYLAVVISAIQAVYFSVLGAAIDRPLWKYKGARDSLQRFFVLWFIINLTTITLLDIQTRFIAAGANDQAIVIEVIVFIVHVMSIPVGACIMHKGALDWNELAEALQPLVHLPGLAMLPIAASFVLYALSYLRAFAATQTMPVDLILFSVTDIPLLVLEAYIFVLVWRICMYYRTLPPDNDNPFDF